MKNFFLALFMNCMIKRKKEEGKKKKKKKKKKNIYIYNRKYQKNCLEILDIFVSKIFIQNAFVIMISKGLPCFFI